MKKNFRLPLPIYSHSQNQDPGEDQIRTSLKYFLLFWIRFIVSGSVALMVLGVVLFVYRTEALSWEDRQNEAVQSGSHTIDLFLRDNYETLVTISRMDINLLTLFPQILQENLRRSPALKEIVRLDAKGNLLTSATQDRAIISDLTTLQQSEWFLTAKKGEKYLGDVKFTTENNPYIIMAVPTTNQGVVAARLEMKVLQEVVNNIHFGTTGSTYIMDTRGSIIAHPDNQVVSRQLDLETLTVFQEMLSSYEQNWHGEFPNFFGQMVVGSSAAIPDTNWLVITEISRKEAYFATLQALILLVSILLLFGILINFATVRLIQIAIFNPVSTLSAGAERIGVGNLQERVPVIHNDEIGDVAKAFNQMARQLSEREVALRQARDEAINASQFKSRLLANVGHDLRTPINMILGYADIIHEGRYGDLTQQQKKAVDRILSSSRRLMNLVNSILDESQIEVGKLTLNNQPFDPRDVLQSVRDALEVPAQAKGVVLETYASEQLPAQLLGDVQRIHQIVWNLAENSLKFTQQGRVSVFLDRSGLNHWSIEVSDTGIGIPPEAQENIFEAFQQVDGSTTRENSGVGLGLSIVKQLTHLMGGSIQLQSAPGQGSTFKIILPITIPISNEFHTISNRTDEVIHNG